MTKYFIFNFSYGKIPSNIYLLLKRNFHKYSKEMPRGFQYKLIDHNMNIKVKWDKICISSKWIKKIINCKTKEAAIEKFQKYLNNNIENR